MSSSAAKKKDKHIYEHDLIEIGQEMMRTLSSILNSKILKKRFFDCTLSHKKGSLTVDTADTHEERIDRFTDKLKVSRECISFYRQSVETEGNLAVATRERSICQLLQKKMN